MARSFNGSSDVITTGDSTAWDSLTALSLSCWINATSVAARGDIFGRWKGDGGASNASWILLQGVTSKRLQFFVTDGTNFNSSGADTSDLTTGSWIHIAGTWISGSPIRLWRAGSNTASSGNITGTAPNTAIATTIGANAEPSPAFFSGQVAECALWTAELTGPEVVALASGYSPLLIRRTSLLNYWPLIGRNSPELDVVGGMNGTLTGTSNANHPRVIYPKRRQFFSAAGGTQSFSYTASGGLTFAGAAGLLRAVVKTGVGGLLFAGTSAMTRVAARVASGGIVFGGAATVAFHDAVRTVQAAGGIVFGGAAAIGYTGGILANNVSAFIVTICRMIGGRR